RHTRFSRDWSSDVCSSDLTCPTAHHRRRQESRMSALKLDATVRTEFGKGAARRIRRAHQIPAVVYGHGAEPRHIALPGHATMMRSEERRGGKVCAYHSALS